MKYLIHLPMKMEPIVSSETSAIRTQTPGNYPKRNNLQYGFDLCTEDGTYCAVRFFPDIILVSSPCCLLNDVYIHCRCEHINIHLL